MCGALAWGAPRARGLWPQVVGNPGGVVVGMGHVVGAEVGVEAVPPTGMVPPQANHTLVGVTGLWGSLAIATIACLVRPGGGHTWGMALARPSARWANFRLFAHL